MQYRQITLDNRRRQMIFDEPIIDQYSGQVIISWPIRGGYQLTCVVEDSDGEHVANGPAQQPALAAIKDHLESIDGIFKSKHIIFIFR